MKFYTNKISTGKSADFGEFVKKLAASNASLTKKASVEAVTEPVQKEANSANFGDKKAPPFGKKDEEKPEVKAEDGEEKEACAPSCASAEKEVKVAEDKKKEKDGEVHVKMQEMDPIGGTNTGKPEGEKKKESEAKVEVKEAAKKAAPAPEEAAKKAPAKAVPAKKASNDEVQPENKGVVHKVDECCGAPSSKGDDGSEGEGKAKSENKTEKEASKKFTRIANLDAKTKNEWKAYWKNLYPTEYVEALFADK